MVQSPSPPRVSVVIPVFDGAAYVGDAIDSVLAQSGTTPEIVVVDDGSTDATPQILARYGTAITVLRQPHRGHAAAKNRALLALHGEFVHFLDADDLLPTGYLARFLAAAVTAPEGEVFHCGWRGVDFEGKPLYEQATPLDIDHDPFHELAVAGSPHIDSLFVRRSLLARTGGFDESLRLQVDWDFCLRLAAAGAVFRGVPGNVATIRRRSESVSGRAHDQLVLTGLAVLERHLGRHPRCPACRRADAGVALWRRAAVRTTAGTYARRLGLDGGVGRWVGTALAAARRPRLLPSAVAELVAGFRRDRE